MQQSDRVKLANPATEQDSLLRGTVVEVTGDAALVHWDGEELGQAIVLAIKELTSD